MFLKLITVSNVCWQATDLGYVGGGKQRPPGGGFHQHCGEMYDTLEGNMNRGNMHSMMQLGSPDSGLCNDTLRPILSHDFAAGGSAFQMPTANGSATTLSDQLGKLLVWRE